MTNLLGTFYNIFANVCHRQVAHLSTLVHAEKAARHRAMKEMQEYRDELCKARAIEIRN